MVLKFSLYSAAGVTLLLSIATDAFVPSKSTSRTIFELSSSLDRGWDNDDFLSSLSGGSDEIAEANAKYQAHAQSREKMSEWRARQMQMQIEMDSLNASSDEGGDYGPSPELLRKMMGTPEGENVDQVSQQPPLETSPLLGQEGQFQQAPQMQQQAAVPPPPPQQPQMQQQQFYDANGNPISIPMVYDANGNLVQFYQQPPPPQQQQQMQQQPAQQEEPINNDQVMQHLCPTQESPEPVSWEPPLPPNPKTLGDEPRPVGYNEDAYAVSNTADVYFAQLKQDSRVRKRAWLAGDKETANEVFSDQSVTAIKDQWVDNPYTREKNIQEARAEIEGAVRMQQESDDESTKFSSGVSYKQKLAQMKAQRGGGGGGGGVNNNF
eukprot:CAMPEP_0201700284 /NCGR_PEP_ID=MMETSP0578-20130828/27932_1 /ASSEMBLY_ACC=CAM_ASM_000663 /TAXON_ID=267565 /ORGANISM="Skeletonema grethea, Strain CCMP 1804" /LENGTH=378 /DNA_ID=CAMNT_0048187299 /DNA_START=54 /DNA_END=1190 /DNA_ORIENTATION=+